MFKAVYKIFHRHYHLKYHGVYRQAKKLFIFDLCLLGLAIAMLGASLFFFFWKPGITDLVDISISLGAERIKSGENATITIYYGNRSKQNLQNAYLSLRLPAGFIIDRQKTPSSVFSDNGIHEIKNLRPGEKGQLEIDGQLWTGIGSAEKIIAMIFYRPENSKRLEQKISVMLVDLPESVLSGELSLPAAALPGASLPFIFKLKNSGQKTVDDIRLSHSWPGEMIFADNLEDLSLEPGEEKTINGTVNVPGKSGKEEWQIFTAVLVNRKSLLQTATKQTVTIFKPKVSSAAKFINAPPFAEPGAVLPLEIRYQNNSQSSLQNLKIKITFNPAKVVDIRATAKENNLKIINNELVADGSARTALTNSQPGKEDSFTINLKLVSHFSLGSAEMVKLLVTPITMAALSELPGQTLEQKGESDEIRLATEVAFEPEVLYYTEDGDQLGRGPLPPRIGETTKYWVFTRLKNTTNDLQNASFFTTLPLDVEFTGRQSVTIGPRLNYDENTRKVTWSYKEIPAQSQTGLYFEVAVTPTLAQVGKNIRLTENLYFNASDSFTGKVFSLTASPLTNILNKNDQGAKFGSLVTE